MYPTRREGRHGGRMGSFSLLCLQLVPSSRHKKGGPARTRGIFFLFSTTFVSLSFFLFSLHPPLCCHSAGSSLPLFCPNFTPASLTFTLFPLAVLRPIFFSNPPTPSFLSFILSLLRTTPQLLGDTGFSSYPPLPQRSYITSHARARS